MSKYLLTGKIVGVFGLKGELKVISESDTNRFIKDNELYLGKNETKLQKVKVSSSRVHKGMYLITINDLFDINLVEKYVGLNFYIDREEMDDLEDGEFYLDDLIGLKVINQNKEVLGPVVEVLDLYHPVIEIELKNGKKILMPFVKEYVKGFDEEYIYIEEIEGFR